MKKRRKASYKLMWRTLMARVLALTGRVLAPTKIVMDYEVKMKPTFLNLEPRLSIGRRPFN
jgi:hypothetical protein